MRGGGASEVQLAARPLGGHPASSLSPQQLDFPPILLYHVEPDDSSDVSRDMPNETMTHVDEGNRLRSPIEEYLYHLVVLFRRLARCLPSRDHRAASLNFDSR